LERAGDAAGAAEVTEPVAALLTDLDAPEGLVTAFLALLPD
jgi:hypothetical protein